MLDATTSIVEMIGKESYNEDAPTIVGAAGRDEILILRDRLTLAVDVPKVNWPSTMAAAASSATYVFYIQSEIKPGFRLELATLPDAISDAQLDPVDADLAYSALSDLERFFSAQPDFPSLTYDVSCDGVLSAYYHDALISFAGSGSAAFMQLGDVNGRSGTIMEFDPALGLPDALVRHDS